MDDIKGLGADLSFCSVRRGTGNGSINPPFECLYIVRSLGPLEDDRYLSPTSS